MMFFEFQCPNCLRVVVRRMPFSKTRSERSRCSDCGLVMHRIFSVPTILIYDSQAGYLNRVASGDITLPGKTPEESRKAATKYARRIRDSHHE